MIRLCICFVAQVKFLGDNFNKMFSRRLKSSNAAVRNRLWLVIFVGQIGSIHIIHTDLYTNGVVGRHVSR